MSIAVLLLPLDASGMWTWAMHYSLAAACWHYQYVQGPLKQHFYVTHTVHFLVFNILTIKCIR